VPAVVEQNQLFERVHRSYYLQNRNNMFITWDYRRAREGARDYRGGMVWHEGKFTFKRDATLTGCIPIMLFYFSPSGAGEGTANTLLVTDAQEGSLVMPIPPGKVVVREGSIAPGGFVTAAPCDTYGVFYAGSGSSFRYCLVSDPSTGRVNQLQVGLGEAGQRIQAGDEIPYRFAMATLGGHSSDPKMLVAQLEELGSSFGLGDQLPSVSTSFETGTLSGSEMFLAVDAPDHEASFRVEPHSTIVDLPIRLQGIEDNGCVAVHSSARPFFRFVGVAEGIAWFQENVDNGSTIWAGNVFVSDHKAIKLTLVFDGLAAGRTPYLEVHNPTDAPIHTTITSPPHTPQFGNFSATLDVPAGASVVATLARASGR
jgi:hypothetical protein